jgi:hypothetical protein
VCGHRLHRRWCASYRSTHTRSSRAIVCADTRRAARLTRSDVSQTSRARSGRAPTPRHAAPCPRHGTATDLGPPHAQPSRPQSAGSSRGPLNIRNLLYSKTLALEETGRSSGRKTRSQCGYQSARRDRDQHCCDLIPVPPRGCQKLRASSNEDLWPSGKHASGESPRSA